MSFNFSLWPRLSRIPGLMTHISLFIDPGFGKTVNHVRIQDSMLQKHSVGAKKDIESFIRIHSKSWAFDPLSYKEN